MSQKAEPANAKLLDNQLLELEGSVAEGRGIVCSLRIAQKTQAYVSAKSSA